MPGWVGHGLARLAAEVIQWRQPEIYETLRENLHHVVGCEMPEDALDHLTRDAFFHAVRAYYDFFRTVGRPSELVYERVEIPQSFIELIRSETSSGRGVLILATHMSNFDLAGLALSACSLSAQVLSLAGPSPGFRLLNDLRAGDTFEITPITPDVLRTSVHRLASGGVVITGADRPTGEERDRVEFFGQPANLPLGPARLALMADVSVIVGSCYRDPDGIYRVRGTGPIEMVRTGNRRQDTLASARRLAAVFEEHISRHPDQWLMFHRVWPEPLHCPENPDVRPDREGLYAEEVS
jgi:KDO2-lipid IV(A) lauroyltransferase